MSEDFFQQLGIPEPEINLEAGGGSQAEQTAAIMVRFEKYLAEHPAALVIVVGDVTSTLACSIVAKKASIPVAHVEGGIRSGDLSMPEEINRIVTDSIADYFFTTSRTAGENLRREGKKDSQVYFVGNTMIDTLLGNINRLRQPNFWSSLGLVTGKYFVMTLHRPSNVDDEKQLRALLHAIALGAGGLPVIFPVHPRTRKNLERFKLNLDKIHLVDPQGYLEFNFLIKHCLGVITDSGGITEETTVMGVPCITLRKSTERPETVAVGTNELIGTGPEAIGPELAKMIENRWKKGSIPELWDGRAAERIVSLLTDKILA
jgi:UDP-N-acetylglucosamine 2-epimerase (non-hydrolysing)